MDDIEDAIVRVIIDSGDFTVYGLEYEGRELDRLTEQEVDDVLAGTGFLPDWGNVPNLLFDDPEATVVSSDGVWDSADGDLMIPVRMIDGDGNVLYGFVYTPLDIAGRMCELTRGRYL